MLIEDVNTLDQYLKVNGSLSFELLEPYLRESDDLFILDPIGGIGLPLYESLVEAASPDEKQTKLLGYLRTATAAYAFTLLAHQHSVNISDAGITVTRTDNEAPASDAKVDLLIAKRTEIANRYLERALEYLEQERAHPAFAVWVNSEAFTIRKELLISSVVEFERYYFIDRSRRTFMKLRPLILQGESALIRPELGAEFYDYLKADYQQNGFQSMESNLQTIFPYVQRALANYAIAKYKEHTGGDRNAIKDALGTTMMNQKAMVEYLKRNTNLFPLYPYNATDHPEQIVNWKEERGSQFVF